MVSLEAYCSNCSRVQSASAVAVSGSVLEDFAWYRMLVLCCPWWIFAFLVLAILVVVGANDETKEMLFPISKNVDKRRSNAQFETRIIIMSLLRLDSDDIEDTIANSDVGILLQSLPQIQYLSCEKISVGFCSNFSSETEWLVCNKNTRRLLLGSAFENTKVVTGCVFGIVDVFTKTFLIDAVMMMECNWSQTSKLQQAISDQCFWRQSWLGVDCQRTDENIAS